MRDHPRVSIVMPVYRSEATLAASLQTMVAQTYQPLEIVVVDSSPDDRCEEIVRAQFPQINYHHSTDRLYPHAARNVGIQRSNGDLILSTDPDIYAPVYWVQTMVQAYLTYWGVIAGAYRNYGSQYVEQAIHICKFDLWLPGGDVRPVAIGPTANILYPRALLEAIGCFTDDLMIGDTEASWKLTALGIPIYFLPHAVVEHHHITTVSEFARERYQRGHEFARFRMDYFQWNLVQIIITLCISLLPIRLTKLFFRTAFHAWQARLYTQLVASCPILLLGHAAWLVGEVHSYVQALRLVKV